VEASLGNAGQIWTVLKPETFTAAQGTTLTPQADGALLAGGASPDSDTYTVTAHTDLKDVTAVRVEVLADDSLPAKGPGGR
jgi:hypothetical protein